jgi:hypothetical protein
MIAKLSVFFAHIGLYTFLGEVILKYNENILLSPEMFYFKEMIEAIDARGFFFSRRIAFIDQFIFHSCINLEPTYNFYSKPLNKGYAFELATNYRIVAVDVQVKPTVILPVETCSLVIDNFVTANNVYPTNPTKAIDMSTYGFSRYYTHFSIYAPIFFGIIFFLVFAVVMLRQNNPTSTMFNSRHVGNTQERLESQKLATVNLKTNKLYTFIKKIILKLFKKH